MIRVVRPSAEHRGAWLALRHALWPDEDSLDAIVAFETCLAQPEGNLTTLLALDARGTAIGFAEASIRSDHVNGCDTSPVAFLEGIYVAPEGRLTGAGRALVDAVADWGRSRGCAEMGSDALLENSASHAFHAAIGFEETERVVCFRRAIR